MGRMSDFLKENIKNSRISVIIKVRLVTSSSCLASITNVHKLYSNLGNLLCVDQSNALISFNDLIVQISKQIGYLKKKK